MSKNIIITLVVVAVVLVGALIFYKNSGAPEIAPPTPTPVPVVETIGVEHTITFDGDAFSPSELTIKKGDTVTWVNSGDRSIWPASDIHPTHSVYPGSGIEKCGAATSETIFDACSEVASGASWSFKFNEIGEWRYHDHLRSSVFGVVKVTE